MRIAELIPHYLQKHVRYHYPNDELRKRVVDSYMRRLDPAKTLFLRAEAEALSKQLQSVLLDVNDGDCETLAHIHADIPKRYEAMEKYIISYVERDDYEIDPNATLVIDSEKRPRPSTREEQHELYQSLTHFQMANYAVALAAEEKPADDTPIDEKPATDADSATDDTGASQTTPETTTVTSEPAKADNPELLELTPEVLAKARKRLIKRQKLQTKRAHELTLEDAYASFLDSFARALDPHSNYLPKEVFEDFRIGMELSLEGIGVSLMYRDGYSVVDKIIPGGAADRLDVLEPSDKIIAVAQDKDGEYVDVIDMDLRDVVRKIRGKRGTTVRLGILRDDKERINISIIRDKINLEQSAASFRIEEIEHDGETFRLGFLELPSFYGDQNPAKRQSSRDMRKMLKVAKKENIDGLVLDLSRNGGGLLENAVEIAGLFVEDGGVVAVKDTYGKLQVMHDPDDSIVFDGPLVVLTSRVSASASEIVAGAMKDYRRAIVVGDDHTFGKGTVQSMVRLQPGLGALKVTTALFFRPGGVSTQNEGVASDVLMPAAFNFDDLGEKHQPYALEAQQVAPFVETSSQGGSTAPWPDVTPELISQLTRLSTARVADIEEFQEAQREIAEARERNGIVQVSDILERNDPDEDEESEDKDEEKLSAQQIESLHILADYVSLGRRQLADNRLNEPANQN